MSRFYVYYTRAALLLAVIVLLATPLAAQSRLAPEPDSTITDELIVRSLPMQSDQFTLLSTTNVIDADALHKSTTGSLGDILSRLVGVANASYGRASGRPVLRGLGDYRIAVLEQGLPSGDVFATGADHANTQNVLGTSQLEVLKGPAALRYGPYAASGVINMLDLAQLDAPQGLSGQYRFAYGTVADEITQSGFTQYTQGATQFRLGAYHRNADNYDIPGFAETAAQRRAEEEEHEEEGHGAPVKGELPNSDLEDIGTSLVAHHQGTDWTGHFAYHYNRLRYGIPAHAEGHEEHGEEEEGEEEEGEEERTSLDLTRHRVLASGSYRFDNRFLQETQLKASFTRYAHTEQHGVIPESKIKQEALALRNDYVLALARGWEGLAGWSYTHDDLDTEGDERYIPSVTTQQVGLYTAHSWDDDVWLLEAAARLDWGEHKPNDILTTPLSTYSKTSGSVSVGAGLRPASNILLGGSVSYAQRMPAIAELFADGVHAGAQRFEVGSTKLDTEAVTGLELYARWRHKGARVFLSAYYNQFDDFVYAQLTGMEREGVDEVRYQQRGAVIQGLELEAHTPILPQTWLEPYVGLRASLLEGRLKNDGYIPLMPPMQFVWTLGANWRDLEGVFELTHALRQDKVGRNERPTPSYVSLGAQLHWQPDWARGVRLSLVAQNLTDEEIRHHTSALKERAPEPGRNIVLIGQLSF